MATAKTATPRRKTTASVSAKVAAAPTKVPTKTPIKAATARVKPQATPSAAVKVASSKTDKKKDKTEKVKVVRDSFTIPKNEFTQIAALKKRAMALGQEVKKSELIRAGLLLLGSQNDAALLKALAAVPTLKTGRPGKA